MLFASADYGFDLLLSMFRERVAAGEHPTTTASLEVVDFGSAWFKHCDQRVMLNAR